MIHSLTLFLFRSFHENIKPILSFTDVPYISLDCARFIVGCRALVAVVFVVLDLL